MRFFPPKERRENEQTPNSASCRILPRFDDTSTRARGATKASPLLYQHTSTHLNTHLHTPTHPSVGSSEPGQSLLLGPRRLAPPGPNPQDKGSQGDSREGASPAWIRCCLHIQVRGERPGPLSSQRRDSTAEGRRETRSSHPHRCEGAVKQEVLTKI